MAENKADKKAAAARKARAQANEDAAQKGLRALTRSVLGKKKQGGSLGRGLVFVITGIGLFLFGLLQAGHHPDMRVVGGCAIVGAAVLAIGTSVSNYRRTEKAGAARTAKVEGRVQQSTSTEHFLDGA